MYRRFARAAIYAERYEKREGEEGRSGKCVCVYTCVCVSKRLMGAPISVTPFKYLSAFQSRLLASLRPLEPRGFYSPYLPIYLRSIIARVKDLRLAFALLTTYIRSYGNDVRSNGLERWWSRLARTKLVISPRTRITLVITRAVS